MDITPQAVLYQAVLFVVLYLVLKRVVFDRFLDSLDQRHHRTRGALDEAAKLRQEAEHLQTDYEAQLAEIRRQAASAKEEIRRAAESGEREVLEAAREEAGRFFTAARARIAGEVNVARSSLEGDVGKLSQQVLETLLKRSS